MTATIEQLAGLNPGIVPDGRSLVPVLADGNAAWRSAILVEGGTELSKADRRYTAVRTATKK